MSASPEQHGCASGLSTVSLARLPSRERCGEQCTARLWPAEGIHVAPVITQVYPAHWAADAFDMASDRHLACKVLLDFTE